MNGDRTSHVRVGVRVRPLTSKEIQQGGKVSLSILPPSSITITSQKTFTYDAVFDAETNQDDLYSSVSSSLLDSFVDGYNATILAYGQTGSGKTYTMGSEAHMQPEASSQLGLIPRFISDFFIKLEKKKAAANEECSHQRNSHTSDEQESAMLLDYHMKASFLEVYGEDVYDLLDSERKSLPLREDSAGSIVVAGLTEVTISSPKEALEVLHEGTNNRTTAATLMNLTSSRSHAVFTIHLTQTTRTEEQMNVATTTSKFTFVDLAGSERMKKTGAEGERAREGIKINEGLLALGNVINALADEDRLAKEKSVHVPYRQSKLTRFLQDALGGNSQTFFLACVSPSDTNVGETLSTLRYANRARNIRNVPTKNVDATTVEIRRLNTLTHVLQAELVKARFRVEDENDSAEYAIGKVHAALTTRNDVLEYLDLIHRTVGQLSGVDVAPSLDIGLGTTSSSKDESTVSLRFHSALPNPQTTPNLPSFDRVGASVNIDVNPDEDIAILDRLLELQQHDHDYENTTKRDDEELRKMAGELHKEETLLLQLRESLKGYHSLKQKYEELMAEVQQLEVEKDDLAKQLEKATADPSTGNSVAIKRQLEKIELSLTRARRETMNHRQKYKVAEDQAKRCQILERKIATLKQAKSSLIKKQKEDSARYKEVTEAKTKELLALKRKERAADARLAKMKTEIQQHKNHFEKRKQYSAKLSEKLKQTEAHLVNLLSMRQREFGKSSSITGTKGLSVMTTQNGVVDDVDTPTSSSEVVHHDDLESVQFLAEKFISERIEQAVSSAQYRQLVTQYSETMRSVVHHVKVLRSLEASVDSGENSLSDHLIDETKDAIAAQELKLELIGADIREMERFLPDAKKEAKDSEAIDKIISTLQASSLRKILVESFSRIVELETEKHAKQELTSRKDAALSSLENELEIAHGKVDSLTRDFVNRKVLMETGDDLFDLLKLHQEKNNALAEELAQVKDAASTSKELFREMKSKLEFQTKELHNTKDSLVLVQTNLEGMSGSIECKETLGKLQTIWEALGVEEASRETIRSALKNCISDTYDRYFSEASLLQLKTVKEVEDLKERRETIRLALRLSESKKKRHKGLLKEVESLRDEVGKLEVRFDTARSRRERIISDTISLASALGITRRDLPPNLQNLMQQIEDMKPSTTTIGRLRRASVLENVQVMVDSISDDFKDKSAKTCLPTSFAHTRVHNLPKGSLEAEFLGRCEDDIAELRVRKSQMLVKNRESVQRIRELAKNLHSTVPGLVSLVEMTLKGTKRLLPMWWNGEDAIELLKNVIVASPRADNWDGDPRCIQLIHEVLETVAERRQRISSLLREVVEKAQEALLDIVGREVDASEAYASFRDALMKLPSLSVDFMQSCTLEIEALTSGVETMTQSEIEALTVVWEALRVSSDDRRDFWGRIDEEISSTKPASQDSDRFARLMQSLKQTQNLEDWMTPLVSRSMIIYHELDVKLNKLSAIHNEVEKLRSKQDAKSQLMSLDSEIRILNSKLQDFDEVQLLQQRNLTKKAGSASLAKEAQFRNQTRSEMTAKLEHLASLLQSWELEERTPFDASLLSDDVRSLLRNPSTIESGIDQRSKLMPSRAPSTKLSPRKRMLQEKQPKYAPKGNGNQQSSGWTPPRKKVADSSRSTRSHGTVTGGEEISISSTRKRKIESSALRENLPNKSLYGGSSRNTTTSMTRGPTGVRKDSLSTILPPFGRILSEISSPNQKDPK